MEGTTTAAQTLVSSLQTNLSAETIMGVFVDVMPYAAGLAVVCLAIYEVRKMTKGASKAKVRF